VRSPADHKIREPPDSAQDAGGTRGEKLRRQKREAPAVVGPGLSCRGVTTILADRDAGR
jgi:hypothetical protein